MTEFVIVGKNIVSMVYCLFGFHCVSVCIVKDDEEIQIQGIMRAANYRHEKRRRNVG